MWITILLAIVFILQIWSATIPTQQRTSLVPYSLPGGEIDPHHHYISCGYKVIGSDIVYLAKRQYGGPGKFKLIKVNLTTMAQDETPSDPDTFIEFDLKENIDILGFIIEEYPNLTGLIALKPIYIASLISPTYYQLSYIRIDSSTMKIEYTKALCDIVHKSSLTLRHIQPILTITELTSSTEHDIYIQLNKEIGSDSSSKTGSLIKFSTALNETLYVTQISDIASLNLMSFMLAHGDIIVAVEVKEQGNYHRPLGSSYIGVNQRSICITRVEKKQGRTIWMGCYGYSEDDNQYVAMDVYDNNIFLLYQAQTEQFGSNNDDLVLDVIDLRTGMVLSTQVYGSTMDEQGLDLVINQFGIYVMAKIGDGFKDLSSSDGFTTQNSNFNLAIILMSHSGDIQEIESYDMTDVANGIDGEEPKKLIVARQNKHDPLYAFIGYRDHTEKKVKGGVYITVVDDNQALFVTGNTLAACSSVSANWELCHTNVCFKCENGYKVQDGVCKSVCDDHYYHQHDDADDTKDIDIWLPCHETCLTCFDGTANGCLTWDADKVIDSTHNTCSCNTGSINKYLGLNGVCVSDWDYGLAAISRNECYRSWPGDSSGYSAGTLALARDKSASTDCYDLNNHLHFVENTTYALTYSATTGANSTQFTTSFWVFINETSYSVIPLLSYRVIYKINAIKDGSDNLMLQFTVYSSTDDTTHEFNSSYSFGLQEWTYCSLSFYPTNRTANEYQINIVTKTSLLVEDYTEYSDVEIEFSWTSTLQIDGTLAIIIGQSNSSAYSLFTGYMNMIFVNLEPRGPSEMLSSSHRSPFEKMFIHEYKLQTALIVIDANEIIDYAKPNLNVDIGNQATSPKIKSFLADTINVWSFYFISHCYSVNTVDTPNVFAEFSDIESFSYFTEDGSFTFTEGDEILIMSDHYEPCINSLVEWGSSAAARISKFKFLRHDGTKFTFEIDAAIDNILKGYLGSKIYNFYYYRVTAEDIIDLGWYNVLQTVPSVYPIEGHSKLGESMFVDFALDVYNYGSAEQIDEILSHSIYDEYIALALDWNDVDPSLRVQRQPDGTFQSFDTASITASGHYRICWKPPYIMYEGYQVATNGYWTVTEATGVSTSYSVVSLNNQFVHHNMYGTFTETDIFQYFTGASDCQSGNKIGKEYSCSSLSFTGCIFSVWFPDTSLGMHLCWKSETDGVYSAFERVDFSNGTAFSITLTDVTASNQALPQILEFSHENYGVIYEGESFWFSFANATHGHPNVVPSHSPYNSSDLGKLEVIQNSPSSSTLLDLALTHENEDPNQGSVQCQKDGEQAGKWFIEGLTFAPGTWIYIHFYSNSFSYSDGTTRHYLFGDRTIVANVYSHVLYVMEDLIKSNSNSIKDQLSFNIKVVDRSLWFYRLPAYFYLFEPFTYQSITLSLYVSGQTCETPHATVNLFNTINSTVYVKDLDLKNWTAGDLMADATIKLAVGITNTLTVHQTGITLGSIGCNEAWDTWYGSTSYDWITWSDDYPYYSVVDEQCTNEYFQSSSFFKDYNAGINGSYLQYYTLPHCPFGYYSDERHFCMKCFDGWQKCTGAKPEDCTLCEFSSPFLLDDTWIDKCPHDLYDYDYINYKWKLSDYYDASIISSTPGCQTSSLYSKDNLSVDIRLIGVSSAIMINAGGSLVMSIGNKRGNITRYKFTQVTPTPDPNDELTNVFPLIDGTTNQYLNETQSVDLNSESIENYAKGTIFKVLAEVENDWGGRAIDYITFMLNPPPTIGTAAITCLSSPWAVLEQITVTLTGDWYNENSYEMELYIKISLELPDGTTVLLVPEQWEQTVFTFVLPEVSTVNETVASRLLIAAINLHDNTSTLSKSLIIDNTLPDGYESSLFSPGLDVTDLNDLALLSSQMELLLSTPTNILNKEGKVCFRDSDCSSHGIWINNGLTWQWDDGYAGVDCSMNYQVFSSLTDFVEEAVDYLSSQLTTTNYGKRSNFQMEFEILARLLSRPDMFEFEQVNKLLSIIEEMANLKDEILLALPIEFDEIFTQFANGVFIRIQYEIIWMAHYNQTEFLNLSSAYVSYSAKLESIQSMAEFAWIAVEGYFIKASTKLTKESPMLSFNTDIASFQAEYIVANSLYGTAYTLNSKNSIIATFPSDLFEGSILTDLSVRIRMITISWSISPLFFSNIYPSKPVSEQVSLYMTNSSGNIISILSKNITFSIPLEYDGNEDISELGCKAWSIDFENNSMSESVWKLALIDSSEVRIFDNWDRCESGITVAITASQLSSYLLTELTDHSIQESKYKGVGNKKSKRIEEPLLYKTKFMLWIYWLAFWYVLGMLLFAKCEKNEV